MAIASLHLWQGKGRGSASFWSRSSSVLLWSYLENRRGLWPLCSVGHSGWPLVLCLMLAWQLRWILSPKTLKTRYHGRNWNWGRLALSCHCHRVCSCLEQGSPSCVGSVTLRTLGIRPASTHVTLSAISTCSYLDKPAPFPHTSQCPLGGLVENHWNLFWFQQLIWLFKNYFFGENPISSLV